MFGLKTIIVAAIPVLMFIYPLVVAIIILTFLNNLIPALVTGLQTAKISLGPIDNIFNTMVPLHTLGMGWISFTIVGFIIGLLWKAAVSSNKASQ